MDSDSIMVMTQNALAMVFYLSMPIILAATVIGLLVAVVQTLIQVQEQTVAFAAKLTAVIVLLLVMGPTMAASLRAYAELAFSHIIGI